jgi:hypothetical protein
MKRQAISISLDDLDKIKEQIENELLSIESLGILKKQDRKKIRVQFNIVNYSLINKKKKTYMSDTWEFEVLRNESKGNKKSSK